MKIKIRKADSLYSKWLRQDRNWTCEVCLKRKVDGMQCSHFYGRANEAVRFDPRNTDCLCFYDHQQFTANPANYYNWKLKKIGEQEFKKLMIDANAYKKRDDELVIMWLNKLMGKEIKQKSTKDCNHGGKVGLSCFLASCGYKKPKGKKEKKENGVQMD